MRIRPATCEHSLPPCNGAFAEKRVPETQDARRRTRPLQQVRSSAGIGRAQSLAPFSAKLLHVQTQDSVAPSPLAVREPVLQSPVAPHHPRTGIRDRAALPATAANRCQIALDLGSTSDARSLGRARVASSR